MKINTTARKGLQTKGDSMDSLRIVLCDTNKREVEGYAAICRSICEQSGIPADLRFYSNSAALMFDMNDVEFSSSISIFIVDPDNGFAAIPTAVRTNGYDGVILYLSHSNSPEHYRQAFDVDAYNFIEKGTNPDILARFHSVFETALQKAKHSSRQYLMVSYAGEYKRIDVSDILYFEAASNHMINVVYSGGNFQFLNTMQSLEERYGDRGFVRAHRSYLVSVNAIHRQVSPNKLILNDGRSIVVSRDRSAALKSAMACWQN